MDELETFFIFAKKNLSSKSQKVSTQDNFFSRDKKFKNIINIFLCYFLIRSWKSRFKTPKLTLTSRSQSSEARDLPTLKFLILLLIVFYKFSFWPCPWLGYRTTLISNISHNEIIMEWLTQWLHTQNIFMGKYDNFPSYYRHHPQMTFFLTLSFSSYTVTYTAVNPVLFFCCKYFISSFTPKKRRQRLETLFFFVCVHLQQPKFLFIELFNP